MNACVPYVHSFYLRNLSGVTGEGHWGLNYEMIELEVTRPPRGREAALRAAEEYFDYCQDIVLLGKLTIEVQAAILMESSIWRFWWD